MGVTSSNLANGPASNAVRELLKCPLCFNLMYPPIHQCSNGHTICSGCIPKVQNKCPTCRDELGNIRCLALEKVATSPELQRVFKFNTPYNSAYHFSNSKPYNCPYHFSNSKCAVIGDSLRLVAHLKDDHKVFFHSACTFSHRYVLSNLHGVKNSTWSCTVCSCFGEYFCLHFEEFHLGNARVLIAFLRFMGDDNDAKKYNYSLEVGGNGRKMWWQGTPRSIRDSNRKVLDSFDGLIIQRSMALSFSREDSKESTLQLTCRIWGKK